MARMCLSSGRVGCLQVEWTLSADRGQVGDKGPRGSPQERDEEEERRASEPGRREHRFL